MGSRRASTAVLALAALLCLVYLAGPAWAQAAAYDFAGVPLAVAATLAARTAVPRLRPAAVALAAGGWLLVAGAVGWDAVVAAGGDPAGGWPDLAYVAGSAALLGALLAAVWTSLPSERALAALVTAVVAPVVGSLAWTASRVTHPDRAFDAATAASLALAVLGVLALVTAARLMPGGGWRTGAGWLMVAGLALRAGGDVAYLVLPSFAEYKSGRALDLTWMLGKLLLGAAVLHPGAAVLLRVRDPGAFRLRAGQVAGMALLVLLAPGAMLLPLPDETGHATAAGASALSGLAVVAMLVLLTRRVVAAQAALAASEARYRAMFVGNAAVMLLVEPYRGRILDANPAAEAFYGWSARRLRTMRVSDLNVDGAAAVDHVRSEIAAGGRRVFDFTHRVADGTVRAVEVATTPVAVQGRHLWYSTVRDVTALRDEERARREAEERLRHAALHDPLTGLANRTLLLDRIGHALERAARHPVPLTVLFCDLDRFKLINDGFGHDVGDQLLTEVARRLAAATRPADTLARIGGDEFAVLCEDTGTDAALHVAQRLVDALAEPFALAGQRLYVGASVGVAGARADSTAQRLLRDADLAMYRAKEAGRGRVEVFATALHADRLAEARMESGLHAALADGQLRVHYQPVVTLPDGRPVGVEALVRWAHPTLGLLAPGDFVPAAEANGLIVPLGVFVLREACRQAGRWHARGLPAQVSVNLSAGQFTDPGLPALVVDALGEAGLPARLLALEMTESLLMDQAETTLAILEELAGLGVRLLVDDFGTGYSSLSYLRRFPVHGVKIDRTFVDGVPEDPHDTSIVTAVVQLAGSLGLGVTAEGIERPQQVQALASRGCGTGQGYLFARPAPAAATEEYLRTAGAGPRRPVPAAR